MGIQIGSDDEKQVVRLKSGSIYSNVDGKGDKPRPGTYSKQYKDNWERIFRKTNTEKDE